MLILWLLCLLIICFRNQKPILLFIGISTIIYLIIHYVNNHQIDKTTRQKLEKEKAEAEATKTLLSATFMQWQEIDGPYEFIYHPTLINVYYHLCQKAVDRQSRENVRSSIQYAEMYLQHDLSSKEKRDALYNCIKYLDIFINDPTYADTVVLVYDYLTSVNVT